MAEEVFSVGFREASVAFSDVGGNRKSPFELVNERTVTAGELLGKRCKLRRRSRGTFGRPAAFELEGHSAAPGEESRAVESRPSKKRKSTSWQTKLKRPGETLGCESSTALLSLLYSLFFGPEGPKNRGGGIRTHDLYHPKTTFRE